MDQPLVMDGGCSSFVASLATYKFLFKWLVCGMRLSSPLAVKHMET